MAKSKNHTNHNQSKYQQILFVINLFWGYFELRLLSKSKACNSNYVLFLFTDRKAHRNGIKKPVAKLHESTLGVSISLLPIIFIPKKKIKICSILQIYAKAIELMRVSIHFRWMPNSSATNVSPAKVTLVSLKLVSDTKKRKPPGLSARSQSSYKLLKFIKNLVF